MQSAFLLLVGLALLGPFSVSSIRVKESKPDASTYNPLSTYCDSPLPQYVPFPEAGAELIQVHVHHRHGDRVPNEVWPYASTILNAEVPTFTCPARVRTAGGRTYLLSNEINNQGYPGNCTLGQLTMQGWKRLQQVGAATRDVYVNKIPFLPSQQNSSKLYIFASASTSDRCIDSSQAFLEGLYPPGTEADITINLISEVGGDPLSTPWSCANYTTYQSMAYAAPSWQQYVQDYVIPAAKTAAPAWNVSINTAYSMLNNTMDIFGVVTCAGLPYPGNFTPEVAGSLAAIRASFYWGYCTAPWGRGVFAADWFTKMLNMMEAKLNGQSDVQFVEWSGHDISIMTALGAMGYTQFDFPWPGYGSTLFFEVWKTTAGAPLVRVIYEGKVLNLPAAWGCGAQGAQGVCSFASFQNQVNTNFAVPGWQQLCPVEGRA